MNTPITLLDFALAYAALGWKVVPCHHPTRTGDDPRCSCGKPDCESVGKHPRTPNGLKNATTDEAQIRDWWTRWPNANIALVGIGVIIDIDPDNGGDIDALNLTNDECRTPIAFTGSGGAHIIYAQPEGHQLTNAKGNLPIGIDVRGCNGYIIAAPSLHKTGNRYEWAAGYEPWNKPIVPLPTKLLDRILNIKRSWRGKVLPEVRLSSPKRDTNRYQQNGTGDLSAWALAGIEREIDTLRSTGQGGRNNALVKAAYTIGGMLPWGVVSEDEMFNRLVDAATSIGLPRHEAEQTAMSGLTAGARNARTKPNLTSQQRIAA